MAAAKEGSVDEVCNHLRTLKVHENIISCFRENKMDINACWTASDEELALLGLKQRGDIINLKAFCVAYRRSHNMERMPEMLGSTSKKMKLAKSIQIATRDRIGKGDKINRLQQKTIYLGWSNYCKERKRYIAVRASSGGGIRKVAFPNDTKQDIILKKLLELFFPGGRSKFGCLNIFDAKFADQKGDLIEDATFSLSEYIERNKYSKTKFLLLTSEKSSQHKVFEYTSRPISPFSDEDDFDIILPSLPDVEETLSGGMNFEVINKDLKKIERKKENGLLFPTYSSTPVSSSLIGSSTEREQLKHSISKAFEDSLIKDQEKSIEKRQRDDNDKNNELEKATNKANLVALMEERKSRVSKEPSLTDPHVTVSIRHCNLGTRVRLFTPETIFCEIYDWVGSLSPQPAYFDLLDYNGRKIISESKIYDGAFNMMAINSSPPTPSKDFLSSTGLEVKDNSEVSHSSVIEIDSSDSIDVDPLAEFKELDMLRESESKRFVNPLFVTVRRDFLYDDLIKVYQKRSAVTSTLILSFENEDGVGDGVSRDAYSGFFEKLYEKMDGAFEKVPSGYLDEEELEIIGKIITHAFLTHGIFPVQICSCSLKYYIFDSVSENDILASFLKFLPSKESDMIINFKSNNNCNTQPIMDILSDYSIFSTPTEGNINQLSIKAGKAALIRSPCFAMQSLIKGMGHFWVKLSKSQFDTIYSCTSPQPELIIQNLTVNEETKQESRILTWFHRYIRTCSQQELIRLVRFITGSSMITPNSKIKLQFVDQSAAHLRPLAKTCFKIFFLPRQYHSFTQLSDNLNTIIGNPDLWSVHDA